MIWKEMSVLIALFAIAIAATEPKHSPHHHHNGHNQNSVPDNLDDTKIAPSDQLSPTEGELVVKDEETQEIIEDGVNEASKKKSILKSRQEEADDQFEDAENELKKRALWLDCDNDADSRLSCFDCRTRLICRYPYVQKLVRCNYALKPYCNNGFCSAVPSANCT